MSEVRARSQFAPVQVSCSSSSTRPASLVGALAAVGWSAWQLPPEQATGGSVCVVGLVAVFAGERSGQRQRRNRSGKQQKLLHGYSPSRMRDSVHPSAEGRQRRLCTLWSATRFCWSALSCGFKI